MSHSAPAASSSRVAPAVLPKQHRRYLFYRAFALAVVIGLGATALVQHLRGGSLSPVLYLIPFGLPALIPLFNLSAYPFAYSLFGPYVRAGFPAEAPRLVGENGSGSIGWLNLRGPFLRLVLYPSGLGVVIMGVSHSFIPRSQINAIHVGGWLGSTLHHDCPEVRSPIHFGDKRLAAAAHDLWFAQAPRPPQV